MKNNIEISDGDILRLKMDLPAFGLFAGDLGIVLSYEFSFVSAKPSRAYVFFPFGNKENHQFLIGSGPAGSKFSSKSVFYLSLEYFDSPLRF